MSAEHRLARLDELAGWLMATVAQLRAAERCSRGPPGQGAGGDALEQGDLERAMELLKAIREHVRDARRRAEARLAEELQTLKAQMTEEAAATARLGELAMARNDLDAAAEHFADAAGQLPARSPRWSWGTVTGGRRRWPPRRRRPANRGRSKRRRRHIGCACGSSRRSAMAARGPASMSVSATCCWRSARGVRNRASSWTRRRMRSREAAGVIDRAAQADAVGAGATLPLGRPDRDRRARRSRTGTGRRRLPRCCRCWRCSKAAAPSIWRKLPAPSCG